MQGLLGIHGVSCSIPQGDNFESLKTSILGHRLSACLYIDINHQETQAGVWFPCLSTVGSTRYFSFRQ
jgi:hypothetical protein